MGKFNLGNADVVVSNLVDNKELDINCDYANNYKILKCKKKHRQ